GRTSVRGGAEEQTVRSVPGRGALGSGSLSLRPGRRRQPEPGARRTPSRKTRGHTRRPGSVPWTYLVMLAPGSRRHRLPRRHQHFPPAPSRPATAAQPAPPPPSGQFNPAEQRPPPRKPPWSPPPPSP
ncbi:hypothetical protein P7K49_001136, partial [Saguinus oedipus]